MKTSLALVFGLVAIFSFGSSADAGDPDRFAEYQRRLAERRATALALRAQRNAATSASSQSTSRFVPAPALTPGNVGFQPALNGFVPQPALRNFVPQPALRGFVPQPALRGFAPQPALRGFVPQPALRGFTPQPALRGFSPQPALRGFTPRPAIR